MSYQALARKWRPKRFNDLVGQAHVVRALSNALDQNRVHHAFLFTGTRGVGKTTIARILARCLNCERGVSSTPCGECVSCLEIDEGRHVDLIEVDAASRAKVDETRELMNNVQFAPTRARYKIYLIDEVHMFSDASFNALLKTLEEPPEHVKFLLATTDPQRMPVTVLSRCLQFSLKRLPVEQIAERLDAILDSESVSREPLALRMLSRAADGSLRDALSLLDQAIVHGGGKIEAEPVRGMLGLMDRQHVRALVTHLTGGDGVALMDQVDAMAGDVSDYGEVLSELLAELKGVAVAQMVPEAHAGAEDEDLIFQSEIAERSNPEDVQLFYQIGLIGRRDLPLAPDPRTGFEMTLLRMLAFRPASGAGARAAAPSAQRPNPTPATTHADSAPPRKARKRVVQEDAPPAEPDARDEYTADGQQCDGERVEAPPAQPAQQEAKPGSPPLPLSDFDWKTLVPTLAVSAMSRELALNCECLGFDGEELRLRTAPQHQALSRGRPLERLTSAVKQAIGRAVKITVEVSADVGETPATATDRAHQQRLREANDALAADQGVQAIVEAFNGRIEEGSIRLPQ